MGNEQTEQVTIADALFTRVQQRVLGILYGQPDRSFLSKDVIRLANSGTGAVHRELKRLVASGLVRVESQGWEKHYQANRESPVYEELRAVVLKTVGLAEPIREALRPLADGIKVAFVYGSVARGTDTATSDIDLMIISEGSPTPKSSERFRRRSGRWGDLSTRLSFLHPNGTEDVLRKATSWTEWPPAPSCSL